MKQQDDLPVRHNQQMRAALCDLCDPIHPPVGSAVAGCQRQYKVVEQLAASGRNGCLLRLRGEDQHKRKYVAKFFHRPRCEQSGDHCRDLDAFEHFKWEARFLRSFSRRRSYPTNIVRYLDEAPEFDAASWERCFYVMEDLGEASLEGYIARGAYLPDDVLRIAKGIARGMREIHRLGILHLDIKPANISLSNRLFESEIPKILDFGSAVYTANALQWPEVAGDRHRAPDQHPQEASDVFSLGLTLLELVHKELSPLQAGATWDEKKRYISARLESFPENYPRRLRDLLRLMTAATPSERPSANSVYWGLQMIAAAAGGSGAFTAKERALGLIGLGMFELLSGVSEKAQSDERERLTENPERQKGIDNG